VRRTRVSVGEALLSAGFVLGAAGCGRRATQADCQLIVNKSVELQMKAMSQEDPSAIQKRSTEVRAELESEIKSCENRRVTDQTIACVQAASATRELDRCLR